MPSGRLVKSIGCGRDHCIAVTYDGNAYAWGKGDKAGQTQAPVAKVIGVAVASMWPESMQGFVATPGDACPSYPMILSQYL